MKRLGILTYSLAIVLVVLLTARETIQPSVYLYQRHTTSMVALGVTGWFIATLGPIALSVCIWTGARRLKTRWALHLVFIPLAVVIYNGGACLLFRAAGVPDGDSIEGYTLIAATAFLLLTIAVHTAALVADGYKQVRARSDGN